LTALTIIQDTTSNNMSFIVCHGS